MDTHEQYERWTGERDPHDFDKKCEDCGHMVSNHFEGGCIVPMLTGREVKVEACGCTSYEWADDDG